MEHNIADVDFAFVLDGGTADSRIRIITFSKFWDCTGIFECRIILSILLYCFTAISQIGPGSIFPGFVFLECLQAGIHLLIPGNIGLIVSDIGCISSVVCKLADFLVIFFRIGNRFLHFLKFLCPLASGCLRTFLRLFVHVSQILYDFFQIAVIQEIQI